MHSGGKGTLASQMGSLILVADKCCLNNVEGDRGLIKWRSKATSRVCRSTFAGDVPKRSKAVSMHRVFYILLSFLMRRFVNARNSPSLAGGEPMAMAPSTWKWSHAAGTGPQTTIALTSDPVAARRRVDEENEGTRLVGACA